MTMQAAIANPSHQLQAIKALLLKLPLVEDVAVGNLQRPQFSLPRTALIGWISVHRLLVWKDGDLFFVDTTSGQVTQTGLKAANAGDVFLE